MELIRTALVAFGVILLAELPDKTLIATLILSLRFRRGAVLVGVVAAFTVQCLLMVVAGGVIALLPRRIVAAVVALMFAIGAVLLLRESFSASPPEAALNLDADTAPSGEKNKPFFAAAAISFGVLFIAEWGDASQVATAGLVAHTSSLGRAIAVGVGAWVALVTVAVLAVVAGQRILRWLSVRLLHRIAGCIFALLAALAAVSAFT